MRARPTSRAFLAPVALAGALALFAACSSDSPSEPSDPPPAGGGGGTATYTVTVSASPATIPAGGADSSTITVRVRRADNNQVPPNGTTVVVSASAGAFGNAGGATSGALELTNGQAAVLLFSGPDPTTAVVQAQIQQSIGQTRVNFVEPDTFFISFVQPNVGSPQGGEQVAINGSGFLAPVRVLFGSINAQVQSVSANRIQVVTPPSPSPGSQQATVNVQVTNDLNGDAQASDTLNGGFTYSPAGSSDTPAVFSVTPASGPNEGGTQVTLVGDGFVAPVQVLFGQGTSPDNFEGQEAQIRNVTRTRLEVVSPAAVGFGQNNQNQLVDILVRNLDSGLATIRPAAFKYGTDVLITAVGPGSSPYFGGQLVTIFGQGFDAPVAVELADVTQSVRSVTGTEIVVETSSISTGQCADVSGGVSVTNIETGDSFTLSRDVFTYLVEIFSPVVTGLSVTSGGQAGGTTVVLSGSDLRDLLVTFGGRPASIVSESADGSTVTVRTPFLPDELLRTESCDDNGDGTNGERYLPTAVDLTVTNRATTCEFTFSDAFVYVPSDSSCRNDVGPPPAPAP